MTISAGMVLPGLAGYWVDQKLGTHVVFLLMGLALGCGLAAVSLVRIANRKSQPKSGEKGDQETTTKGFG